MQLLTKVRRIIRWIVLLFFGSTILSVFAYKWLPVYVTPLMVIRCVQQVRCGETIRLRHYWVPMEEMSIYMPVAVMASEDQRFLEHRGFDLVEIENAIREQVSGRRRRGGSTISQQTAKNVFLWPGRSWLRKGLEVYFTALIELVWGKHRIMEVYLNSIEMGDGIYGAEAVAQWHFGRSASELTRPNCALVAATLPNPVKFSSKEPSPYMLRRQTAIMKQMRHIDVFPAK
ncbi:MAG: monofunctional biosynthetic peptidoglycan transglycosylase [Bacteroidaceae bacterium]|nr:monofunctional biosynthetic peptidoglycan transglycosylase [Bacteroidaceae bacterium]